jgi:hypothetical protein
MTGKSLISANDEQRADLKALSGSHERIEAVSQTSIPRLMKRMTAPDW